MHGATPPNFALTDTTIRTALRARLQQEHRDEHDTVIVDELGLSRGRVRADLAVVNGLLHGYEIKSDRDNFRRLQTQVRLYGNVFDRATIVVGDRYVSNALAVLPSWWGVLHVAQNGDVPQFTQVRASGANPDREARVLVELLWAERAIALLEQRNIARGVRRKPRRIIWDRICLHYEIDEIADAVRACIKASRAHLAAA